jgi:hypothetical protein
VLKTLCFFESHKFSSCTGITIGDWFQFDYSVKSQRTGMRKNIALENVKKLEDPLVPTRIRDGETEVKF